MRLLTLVIICVMFIGSMAANAQEVQQDSVVAADTLFAVPEGETPADTLAEDPEAAVVETPAEDATQDPAEASPEAGLEVAVETPAEVAAVVPPAVDADGQAMVTLDFQDADIRNVLKVLAYKSGVNIVSGPEVSGVVSIQLSNVPWEKALEVILSTYSFGHERKGNIISVMSMENLKKHREDAQLLQEQEPLVTKTYTLSFAKASDVVDSIGKMKTARGTVNFDQRTNTLIVRDVQNAIDLIDGVVKTLDSVTPQVLIEAKIIETGLNDSDKLGIDWTTTFTVSGAGRPMTFPFNPSATNNYITGNFPSPEDDAFKYGTLDASGFQAVLNILKSRTDTNILSNPKIVTLDNQAAKIVVGDQYPIPQYTYNAEQAKLQVSGFEYKDIGVIFEVTPHVNNPGLVTLDLHPQISAIAGKIPFDDGSTTLPQLSVEEARTKVMIENGQTVVIAGLITDRVELTNKKVPFLGDIPLLGKAFRNRSTVKTKKELLIFLTPHIITVNNPPADPALTDEKK